MILIGGLLISVIMAAYFWSTGRNARRLRLRHQQLGQVNSALDAANARLLVQNARFDTALNNMAHGLCFYDGAQRLIVCNSRYIEMHGLPADRIRPGVTLGEIIDLRFEAGSIPKMSREELSALAQVDRELQPAFGHHRGTEQRPRHAGSSSADARRRLGGHARRRHRAQTGAGAN